MGPEHLLKPLDGNVIVKMYLHGDKADSYNDGLAAGLDETALQNFKYALYEVEFDVEVNPENGQHRIVAVDGQPHEGKWNG